MRLKAVVAVLVVLPLLGGCGSMFMSEDDERREEEKLASIRWRTWYRQPSQGPIVIDSPLPK